MHGTKLVISTKISNLGTHGTKINHLGNLGTHGTKISNLGAYVRGRGASGDQEVETRNAGLDG